MRARACFITLLCIDDAANRSKCKDTHTHTLYDVAAGDIARSTSSLVAATLREPFVVRRRTVSWFVCLSVCLFVCCVRAALN